MKMQTLLAIVVVAVIFVVWKVVTAKLVKILVELALVILLIGLIGFIVTGNSDKLPSGENFRKCAYDGKETDYFCVEHAQWECEACHEKYN